MHFLHTDPEQAANGICDADLKNIVEDCIAKLSSLYREHQNDDALLSWVKEDGLNYYWLAFFTQRLALRLPNSADYHTELCSLRTNLPPSLSCHSLTTFPYLNNVSNSSFFRKFGSSFVIASYRTDYVLSRHKIAEWKGLGCPSWFLRIANCILPPREGRDFVRRVQSIGLSSSDDTTTSNLARRQDVRDGPDGVIVGESGIEFRLY